MIATRRPSLAIITICAALLLARLDAGAGERINVYRCEAADGGVSLQDQPCPPSSDESLRLMRRPYEPDTPSSAVTQPTASVLPIETPPLSPPRSVEPLPPLWLCRDFDGAERESSDGEPRGRYVPLWVVGRDPYAPGQLFGRVGEPLANPTIAPAGSPPTHVDRSPSSSLLVYVAEQCFLLSPRQRCVRFAEQRRELERKIFNSQASGRAILAPQSAALRNVLINHCGS